MKQMPLLVLFLFACSLQAQVTLEWQKKIGGDRQELPTSIIQTNDGGYIMIGETESNNGDTNGHHGSAFSNDIWVVKMDHAGAIQWQRQYGGSDAEFAYKIKQTLDGGYVFIGYTWSHNGDVSGNPDGGATWIVKINNLGVIQWKKTFESTWEYIEPVNDGGYVLAGSKWINLEASDYDYHLVKINSVGDILWEHNYGGSGPDGVTALVPTSDHGWLINGSAYSSDGDISDHHGTGNTINMADYWVVKTDSTGVLEWAKSYGGSDQDEAGPMVQASDGGYLLMGQSESSDGDVTGHHNGSYNDDAWAVKIDQFGAIQWQRSLGGSNFDAIVSLIQAPDGGFIGAGFTSSVDGDIQTVNHGNGDAWVIKLSNDGLIQRQKLIGGTASDRIFSITNSTDGGLVFAGLGESENGDVIPNSFGNSYVDIWIAKLPGFTGTKAPNQVALQLFPNPTTGLITLRSADKSDVRQVVVSDLSGHQLLQQTPSLNGQIDISDMPDGVYILTAENALGYKAVGKVIKQAP